MPKDSGYISPNGPLGQVEQDNPVARMSDRQIYLESERELPRTLMQGTEAMRAAGEKYLPKHPAEEDASYKMRLRSTTLYGAFSKTVVRQAGKLFSKPVTLVDADPVMMDFANDVDGEGRTLTAFGNDLVKDGFIDGLSYLMVDFPAMQPGATQADVKAIGARPYWLIIHAQRVLGWKSQNVGGTHLLMQLRFREFVEDPAGSDPYSSSVVEQIRELNYGGAWATWRKREVKPGVYDWFVYDEGKALWTRIPVIPVYINRTGFFEGLPPLRELAELNLEHWVSSSEQRRALSFLRFAMLLIIGRQAGTGKNATPVKIAPDKILEVPLGGDAKYIEHTGAGIKAGLDDLDAIERRMQTAGMEIRIENAGQVTATAAAIDSAEGNAALKAVAKGVEAALNEALLLTGAMLRAAKVGVVHISDEFAEEPPPGDVNSFIALYGAGLLSRETIWDELVRRHTLDDDFDPKAEELRIALEQLTLQRLAMAEQGATQSQPTEGVTAG